MSRDMPRFGGLAVASIAVLLFVLFRRVAAGISIPIIIHLLNRFQLGFRHLITGIHVFHFFVRCTV